MRKILLWACALIIVLGAALTVYAAPAPTEEAARETDAGDEPLDPRDYFEVNELGLTYGCNIYDGICPDLVAAIGTGGVDGYVYMEVLLNVGAKKSPDDVVTDIPSSIPLYASDSVTVIGEFPIGPRTDDVSELLY